MEGEKLAADDSFDYVVIGSGFGGSVSAMRLAQKGYRVAVLEAGRRYGKDEFPKTNWNLRKFLWMPGLGFKGIWRISLLRNVAILGGAGVGGGSLNYANTLYVPPERFFEHESIQSLGGREALLPFYELAKKMLGVVQNPVETESDRVMRRAAEEFGCAETYRLTPVAVYFGKQGETEADPYFCGEGPARTGCTLCGGCMTGCRYDAKNTLDKNYLYFAEKFGATIFAEHKVLEVRPLGEDGAGGYRITARRSNALPGGKSLLPSKKVVFQSRGVVFSAGVLGNLRLLLKMKEKGILPRLSPRLGRQVRTNSEVLLGVKAKSAKIDYSHGVAITSSVYPDSVTHIEPVRFAEGSNAFSPLCVDLIDHKNLFVRYLQFLSNLLLHPLRALGWLTGYRFARRSIILLVMQTLDNCIDIRRKRRLLLPFTKHLSSRQDEERRIPNSIPIAHDFARCLAREMKGSAATIINQALLDIPTTAHILGGCSIGKRAEDGVIDGDHRVFGYQNMLVCDGSVIPANLGVNPSLSIVAFTERAMSRIPLKHEGEFRALEAEKQWQVQDLLSGQR